MEMKTMHSVEEKTILGTTEDDAPGLCLYLGAEQIEKLGLKTMPVAGSTAMIHARVLVKEVASRVTDEGNDQTMELQILEMGFSKEKQKEPAQALYGVQNKPIPKNATYVEGF